MKLNHSYFIALRGCNCWTTVSCMICDSLPSDEELPQSTRPVKGGREVLDCFFVTFTSLGRIALGSVILNRDLQIHQCLGKVCLIVY